MAWVIRVVVNQWHDRLHQIVQRSQNLALTDIQGTVVDARPLAQALPAAAESVTRELAEQVSIKARLTSLSA